MANIDNTRRQIQTLAIAAGMALKDGSPIVIGGPKCPTAMKIIAVLLQKLPIHLRAIMQEPSGFIDADGSMSVEEFLLTHM